MRKFKFNLEAVLTIRQKELEDERINLASITNVYNKQKEVLEEMKYTLAKIEQDSENSLQLMDFNISLISSYSSFYQKVSNDIKVQEQIIEKTYQDVLKQQETTKTAYIKVKSLENLKEKQKAQYLKELQLEEIKELDDIVNSKRLSA